MGVKFEQIDHLSRGQAHLDNRSAAIDPDNRLYPIRPPFVFKHDGKVYSVYLNLVTYLSGLLYPWGGVQACRIIPLFATLVLLGLIFVLARKLELSNQVACLTSMLSLLLTPLWFYGWVFWEHAPAAALCLGGTLLVLPTRRDLSLARIGFAAVLFGMGISCRPESLIYLLGLATSLLLVERRVKPVLFLVGLSVTTYLALLAFLPGLPLQNHVSEIIEKVFTRHWQSHGHGSWIAETSLRIRNLLGGFLLPDNHNAFDWISTASVLGAIILGVTFCVERLKNSLLGFLVLVIVSALLTLPVLILAADGRTQLTGLFTVCPLFVLFLAVIFPSTKNATGQETKELSGVDAIRRIISISAILSIAGGLLLAQNDGGNQWGPRYLAAVFPLLLCLVVEQQTKRMKKRQGRLLGQRLLLGYLVILSFAAQMLGVRSYLSMMSEKEIALSRVASFAGQYIVTNSWFVPQEMALLCLEKEKRFLLVQSPSDFNYALGQMQKQMVETFTIVEPSGTSSAKRRFGVFEEVEGFDFDIHPYRMHASLFRHVRE